MIKGRQSPSTEDRVLHSRPLVVPFLAGDGFDYELDSKAESPSIMLKNQVKHEKLEQMYRYVRKAL